MKSYTTEELMRRFIGVLCATGISEFAVQGITEMMWGNKTAMDQLVIYIKENPKASEAEITKAASKAIGL